MSRPRRRSPPRKPVCEPSTNPGGIPMRVLRQLVAVVVVLVLAAPSWAQDPAKKGKGKKKAAAFRGTVVEVKADAGKDEGVIIVKGVAGRKKNAAPADPQEKTFKVTGATKIETIAGKINK